jgi:hypothetical protein
VSTSWPDSTRESLSSSKRYGEHFDRLAAQREFERLARAGLPESLNPIELELSREPLTKPPSARPVRAFVRYGGQTVRVDALLVAWTDYAAAIKWDSAAGEHHAWVWISSIRPRVI